MNAPWFVRTAPRPDARLRLIGFPNAGVGGSIFRRWPAALPETIELSGVQLPGREGRFGEAPLRRIPAIVDALLPAILALADRPFAFFGHSMGAIVAAETTRALAARGAPLPRHLFVSARRPPHVPGTESPLHRLPDADFVAEINRRYGGIPDEVLRHADLMALVLPALRADLEALETHLPPPREPLPVPIVALGGADDRLTPRAHLDAWRGETTGSFRVRVFPGGHFYLDPCREEVIADVKTTLAPLLAAEAS